MPTTIAVAADSTRSSVEQTSLPGCGTTESEISPIHRRRVIATPNQERNHHEDTAKEILEEGSHEIPR
jgi:hypothetical protein